MAANSSDSSAPEPDAKPARERSLFQIERAIEIRFVTDHRNFLRYLALFGLGIRRCFAEPIFIQRPAALERATPQHDIVLFAPGKIIEREWILGRAHDAQIALNAGAQSHTAFRRTLRNHTFHERMRHK